MAGHGSAPPATGWEGEVRKVLKEDWQVVCGIMGFYTTLYLFSKLFTGGAKAAPEAGTCVCGCRWGILELVCFAGVVGATPPLLIVRQILLVYPSASPSCLKASR